MSDLLPPWLLLASSILCVGCSLLFFTTAVIQWDQERHRREAATFGKAASDREGY